MNCLIVLCGLVIVVVHASKRRRSARLRADARTQETAEQAPHGHATSDH
jgi:hypothetical protein